MSKEEIIRNEAEQMNKQTMYIGTESGRITTLEARYVARVQ